MSAPAGIAGRHAVVTGGGRGIGAAIAEALAAAGARVTVMGRGRGSIEEMATRLDDAQAVTCDVTIPDSVAAAFETARDGFGAIEILVNNAGAAQSTPFKALDEDGWQAMLEVNLSGAFRCTRAVIGSMTQSGFGRIVTVASTAGLT